MVSEIKEKQKKVKDQKKNRKFTREEKLANALKRNMKLRKEKKNC